MSRAPLTSLLFALALSATGAAMAQDLEIPFQKFVLDNGLEVVIHEDHSDPIVSVFVLYHVGSGREQIGRSGFAHLFEHLMFQGSENVGDDEHFRLVAEAGGTLNGSTNRDRTNYFETMPSNQLELALWLEADRMGFLLPAIGQDKLDNQREVVKNERRQNYENRPYGQARGAIMAALYPPEHPYSWLTIGSHEDLSAASLEDVVSFFQRWYGPNNATLAIGGDVDPEQARALVERYFGSIPRGPDVTRPVPRPVRLDQPVRIAMEDKVQLPELTFVWPGVHDGHADEPALTLLAALLSANQASLLDKALTVDEVLVTEVTSYHEGGDLAGEFVIRVRAAPGVELDVLEQRVRGILDDLAREGVDAERLARLKTRYEARVLNRYQTVAARTSTLAEANIFRGDPAAAVRDLQVLLDTRPDAVAAALERYVHGRPAVLMSVVPEGHLEMVASGRTSEQARRERALDRSQRPGPGARPTFQAPDLWHDELSNGVKVTGSPYQGVPLVNFALSVPGGHLRESLDSLGLSSMTAELMEEGPVGLDTVGFTEALDALGATFSVSSDDDEIVLSLRALHKHVDEAVALLERVLLEPRFDPADFQRLRTRRLASLRTRGDSIRTIASNAWARLMHAPDDLAAWPEAGTPDTIEVLSLDDVKAFYARAIVPDGARLEIVGDLDAARVRELFEPLAARWTEGKAAPLAVAPRPRAETVRVYLVDKPGAPQSEIRIGHPGLSVLDEDYYRFTVMNTVLGGTFSSRINMNLREDKGYTYGARSGLSAGLHTGTFTASSGVRTDVTSESVVEFMKELEGVREGFTDTETAFVKDSLMQAFNRQFESISSRQGMVRSVSKYGYPDDYLEGRRALLEEITRDDLNAIAARHVRPEGMTILVVGDAEAVGPGLEELGYGEVVELDIDGEPIRARS